MKARIICQNIVLQWSHVLTNVEREVPAATAPHRKVLQWSHVLTNVERLISGEQDLTAQTGFNGATSSRTWKAKTVPGLNWIDGASMEPRPHERGKSLVTALRDLLSEGFNGATSSRTWKETRFGRPTNRSEVSSSFNGATSSRTWKGRHPATRSQANACFNGATSSRTWKETTTTPGLSVALPLQWSHVLTNVERFIA